VRGGAARRHLPNTAIPSKARARPEFLRSDGTLDLGIGWHQSRSAAMTHKDKTVDQLTASTSLPKNKVEYASRRFWARQPRGLR
jgi:hypothetical protein